MPQSKIHTYSSQEKMDQQFQCFLQQVRKISHAPVWLFEDFTYFDSEVLALKSKERFQAALWFRQQPNILEIDYVMCLPSFRRCGHAKSLVHSLLQLALELDVKRVWLEVEQNNKWARKLYESLGFQRQGRRLNYYGPSLHALNYGIDLTKA